MSSSSLLKSPLHNSIAEALYDEIQNRNARYYYFLGKTVNWVDEATPPYPIDSFDYELQTRNEMITLKEIKSTDVAFVIPRVDWVTGQIWDMYDDQYSDEVQGINLISGGYGYSDPPSITISGGGGTGAVAVPTIVDGVIIGIEMVSRGRGYTSIPTVTISGGGGDGAVAEAKVNIAYSGAQRLEDINSIVITDEYNVYKCLDNNNNAISTYKPIGTVVDPVIMPDGYMWKYLYSIPIALRNKFLTDVYMPVVNSIRSQFYSNGEILNVVLENNGKNYTFASISVAGDGYRESDPLLLQSIQISAAGAGYTSGATVTIDPPFAGANTWVANIGILLGQRVEYNNNIYEATVTGVTASPAPTHKSGIVANGTASLKYIGTRATGSVTVSGGAVTGVVLNGSVLDINITSPGSGYTSAPSVSLSGGGGSNFVGAAVMSSTSVSKVYISDSGQNYTSVPTVKFGTQWAAATAYTAGQQIYYASNLYTVATAGTSHASTAPTHVSNGIISVSLASGGTGYTGTTTVSISAPDVLGGTQATAHATVSGGVVTGIVIDNAGSGYTSTPTITINSTVTPTSLASVLSVKTGVTNGTAILTYVGSPASGTVVLKYGSGYSLLPNVQISPVSGGSGAKGYFVGVKSEAKLIPILADGQITGVQIDNGGIGYTYANLTVQGDGTDAKITADLSPGDINTLQANTELLTPDGRIMAYPVISGGFGYGSNFPITIDGDGTGAAATAIVEGGAIKKIQVDSYGLGYHWAKISFDQGSGVGAVARPVRAPFGGHGKDPITGCFARTLMFYTNISKDTNQGFNVNNDFRQLGIIKNPRQFGSYGNLKSALASACYVITGSIDTANFKPDMEITLGSLTGRKFRIVSVTTTAMLVQSLENAVPTVGASFLNSSSNSFTASGVTAPTADKYSGHILFIDNKQAFTPTADQTVTLRTVIKF